LATKVFYKGIRGTAVEDVVVEEEVENLANEISRAVKSEYRFVTCTRSDGGDVAILAENVVEIRGEKKD